MFCSTCSQLRHYPSPLLPKGLLSLTPSLPPLLVSFTTSRKRKKTQQILNRSSELCLSVVLVKAKGSKVEMIVLFPSQKSHSHLWGETHSATLEKFLSRLGNERRDDTSAEREFREGLIVKDKKAGKLGDFGTSWQSSRLMESKVRQTLSTKESQVPKIPYLILALNGGLLFLRHLRSHSATNSCVT